MGAAFQTIGYGSNASVTSTGNLGMVPFYYAVFSAWLWLDLSYEWGGAGAGIAMSINKTSIVVAPYNASSLPIMAFNYPCSLAVGMHHILVSVDTANTRIQAYVDDARVGLEGLGGTGLIKVPDTVTLAEMGMHPQPYCCGDVFYTDVPTPCDLTITANRRKFITAALQPVDLGPNGSAPFSAVPRVFLHADPGGTVADYIANRGSGGAFTQTGLSVGACGVVGSDGTSPPTGGGALVNADGPGCTPYYITEAAGPASRPQWRLTVSDDGGRTWSVLVKPRDIGDLGKYLTRLRWQKMGQSRERIVRLECTDPVRRNIVGVYMDLAEGMP